MSVENQKEIKGPAEFQTAVAATKFGLYNIILLLIAIPAALTLQFESTLTSYIVPAAQCDLELDPTSKGLLNSMPFFGMVSSGFIWGFLLDTLGRRKILVIGYGAEVFMILGKSLSTNVTALSIFTFFAGSITGGMYVALTTFVTEFHSTEYRGKIQMIFGMMYACGNILIPLLSSAILPLNFTIKLWFIDFHPWNLVIFISCINPLIATIALNFFPESPKFLMSIGQNEKALEVFRKMYVLNTRNSSESYPVKELIVETKDTKDSAATKKSWKEYFVVGIRQIQPLFGKEYRLKLLLVCAVQSMFSMGQNTIRLYLPQVFQATHDYQVIYNGTTTELCTVLEILRFTVGSEEVISCTVNLENNFRVYMYSMIIATVLLTAYFMAGTLINLFGKKRLLAVLGTSASVTVSCLYFSPNTVTTMALSSIYLACLGVCFDIFVTVIVVIFPTTLRAMAISVCLFAGRSLTVLGNNLFPVLVEFGCLPPFLFLGCLALVAVVLTSLVSTSDTQDMK